MNLLNDLRTRKQRLGSTFSFLNFFTYTAIVLVLSVMLANLAYFYGYR